MSLDKNFWENDKTPLSADNLNAMTNQIVDNGEKIGVLESGKQDKIKGEVRDVLVFDENGNPVDSNTSIDALVGKISLIEDAERYDGQVPYITSEGELLPSGVDVNSILTKPYTGTVEDELLSFDFEGNVENSGINKNNVITTGNLASNISGKADKVKPTASGNLASLNSNGNLVDSEINKNDIVTKQNIAQTYESNSEKAQSGKAVAQAISTRQPKLTAGTGIKIENNVISTTNSGGGGGPVDPHYSATSPNAQSGTAVAEAIKDKMNVKIVDKLPARGDESTIYAVTKTEKIVVVDGKDYVECVNTIEGSSNGNTSYVVWGLSYVDGDDGVVAKADLAGQYGAIEIIISDPYIAYCIEHSTKIETNDSINFTKFDIYVPITTSNRYLFVNGRYIDICVGEKTSDNGEIFNTYEDKTYSFSQYPQYNAKVLNSSSANRENGQAYKNKSISEKTTTSGSSNISGCKAFKIIGHSDVRGLNGGAGHYYIEKNSESDKLFNDYCNEATKTKELYGCYSTWLFTNTGGNNRAEMVESGITITPEGSSYKIVVSNFTNLESVKSNFADNVSYIRFYEKYEQSVGNNQTRFIPMPLVELGDTSIEGWSYAGGLNNKAVGLGSFVIGNQNVADGAYSFVAGRQNAGGFTSFVTGRWNKVGQYGAAFGQLNEVSAINGLSAGTRNEIKGKSSGAFGEFNKINSENSIGTGYENHINGNNAIAGGIHNTLNGRNSGALGENNVVNGDNAFVSGYANKITTNNGSSFGSYNKVRKDVDISLNGKINPKSKGMYVDRNTEGVVVSIKWKLGEMGTNGGCHYLLNTPFNKGAYTIKILLSSKEKVGEPSFRAFLWTNDSFDAQNRREITGNNLVLPTRGFQVGQNEITLTFEITEDTPKYLSIYSYSGNPNSTNEYLVTKISKVIEEQDSNLLHSIGNGTSDANRSNAFAVYKDGHAEVQTMGNTDNSVVTKKYADTSINNLIGVGTSTDKDNDTTHLFFVVLDE